MPMNKMNRKLLYIFFSIASLKLKRGKLHENYHYQDSKLPWQFKTPKEKRKIAFLGGFVITSKEKWPVWCSVWGGDAWIDSN